MKRDYRDVQMIDFDTLQEIGQSLRSHKLRTVLAVLTVAWGVFMLVLLLGAGRGLQNGVERQFRDDAVNSIWVYRGQTSIDHQGHPRGRSIKFNNDDYDSIARKVPGVEHITSRFYLSGSFTVSHENQHASFDVRSAHPDHRHLENTIVTHGRFLNDFDISERRKVCVIGARVKSVLFGEQDAVGKFVTISGIAYRVVGLFRDEGSRSEEEKIYLPISTAQLVYGGADTVHQVMYTVAGESGDEIYQQSEISVERTRELLAEKYHFSVHDKRAIRINNNLDEYKKITDLFYWIRVFVAVVGAGTVLTGILAVSNIMLISVAERRREIGIRKALGATPGSITALVVIESLIITALAGYAGLIASLALLELLKSTIAENDYMYQPDVNTPVVVAVTVLVVIAGTLAGYLPARRAAEVQPVEALRQA